MMSQRHLRCGRLAALMLVPLLYIPVTVAPAEAAIELGDADVTVTIADESAEVQIGYIVRGADDGSAPAETVSFSALTFDRAAVDEVTATGPDGQSLDVELTDAKLKTTATVTLPEPLTAGDEVELDVAYRVQQAVQAEGDQRSATVPVLALDAPPPATAPDVFSAALTWPGEVDQVSGFPSSPESVTTEADATTVRHQLPTATAVLRSVVTTEGAPLLTLSRTMNLLLMLLIIGAFVGVLFRVRRGSPTPPDDQDAHDQTQPPGRVTADDRN